MRSIRKKDVKAIIGNRENRILVSNFGYLSLLQVASYVFPLITIPYLAAVVGAEGLGRIAFATAVVGWCLSIVTWGFDFTATRDVARCRDDVEKVSEIFSNVIWARSILTLASFMVLLLLIMFIPSFRENHLVLLVTFVSIPGHMLFPEWMFQALERMKYITVLSILAKLFFTVMIFIFIKTPSDYWLQPLFSSIGFVVSGIISLYFIVVRWKIKILKPSISKIKDTIVNGADVFINNFMPNLYNSMSYVILGSFCGSVPNGILSAGDKCLSIFQQFLNILARTFFPFLSRHTEKHHVYSRISLSISAFFTIVLFIFAPLFIKIFYTDEFSEAITISRILSLSILFLTIDNVYGTNYLIIHGFEKQLRNITMVSSILGFVAAVILIYNWSFYGAAIAIVFARGLMAISVMFYALQKKRILNK